MKRDIPDLAGGLILAAIGLFVTFYSVEQYDIGTMRRMGPGFFPVLLGGTLSVLGLIIALPALGRQGEAIRVAWKECLAVLAAILVFAAGLNSLGLVLATLISVLIATLATPNRRIGWRILLAGIVTTLSVGVFSFGLKMTVPLWPGL
ncbi:tripartite tricarboxylate transporter TctB family protein [Pseudooceanicola sp. HF7]|uniref:tripartite tricarboxylate transporter TctB family protein n=1 Tax=Pseudooceanicola sp. HF7 TaxID=2721560 RepID=UPI00142F6DA6|nr:tripartite tricarboxylate transporter TctB family protein [Pseudooceanicola sp. HF7]NIZ10121.1 tripartite tricarboxylate transporter TctB family protein [Pseudooceanicola sp. HF7]